MESEQLYQNDSAIDMSVLILCFDILLIPR